MLMLYTRRQFSHEGILISKGGGRASQGLIRILDRECFKPNTLREPSYSLGGVKHTDRALAGKESKTASRFNEEGGAGVFIVVGRWY